MLLLDIIVSKTYTHLKKEVGEKSCDIIDEKKCARVVGRWVGYRINTTTVTIYIHQILFDVL